MNSIPFVCLIVACVLPYIWLGPYLSACKEQGIVADPKTPRAHLSGLTGKAAWAYGAHTNAFEALPSFVAGVLAAQVGGADPKLSAGLSVGWVVFRILHAVFYMGGNQPARSGMFALALLCALGLIVLGIMGGASA